MYILMILLIISSSEDESNDLKDQLIGLEQTLESEKERLNGQLQQLKTEYQEKNDKLSAELTLTSKYQVTGDVLKTDVIAGILSLHEMKLGKLNTANFYCIRGDFKHTEIVTGEIIFALILCQGRQLAPLNCGTGDQRQNCIYCYEILMFQIIAINGNINNNKN